MKRLIWMLPQHLQRLATLRRLGRHEQLRHVFKTAGARPLIALLMAFGLTAISTYGQEVAPVANWSAPAVWSPTKESGWRHGVSGMDSDGGTELSGSRLAGVPTAELPFVPVQPCRLVDTRPSQGFPGAWGPPAMVANQTRDFDLNSAPQCGGIPDTAQAYSLNVTVTETQGAGDIRVWPAGSPPLNVSTQNWPEAGMALANAAIVPAGTGGAVTVLVAGSNTHLIIDINGYYSGDIVTNVTAGTGLSGGGSGSVTVGIANLGVGTAQLADSSVTAPKIAANAVTAGTIASGQVVKSLNGLFDGVSLLAGLGTTVQAVGQTLTVAVDATPSNQPNKVVLRDPNGDFAAGSVSLAGNLQLPTSSPTSGTVTVGAARLHSYGHNNTFLGSGSGNFTMSGTHNVAFGFNTLPANSTGQENTAVGAQALLHNTGGHSNTAGGAGAMAQNLGGSDNTALGALALTGNVSGSHNTALGQSAMISLEDGEGNTAVGFSALTGNMHGTGNTAVGARALESTTGSGNIAVGADAGHVPIGTIGDSNIYIGHQGVGGDSDTIRVGVDGTHTRAFLAGVRGVSTGVADGLAVLIDSAGQLGTISSSGSVKRGITDVGEASARLLNLRPVSFFYRNDVSGIRQYGLVAEEVAKVMPELVLFGTDGAAETVRYHFLPALLLNEIQRQRETIDNQGTQIKMLESRLAALEGAARGQQN